ncbi:hypothetical protein [Phycobacter sp. K97]|uniref:hypothetical protein n=1 Tax=Phycobacter sedimenti TaxID=3133977 RepID=UPI00311EA7F2
MKHMFLSVTVVCLAGWAQAGQYCLLDGTEMFSCTLKGGSRGVEVCNAVWEDGTKAAYGYFKSTGEIEKEILQDMATITATPWNGMGDFISDSVTFDAGGGYAYEVWWGSERAADAKLTGGINVLRHGTLIADISCDDGTIRSDLSSLIEMIEAAR